MHRIDPQKLQTTIAVAIKTAPKSATRDLYGGLPVQRDEAARRLALVICSIIDNESCMVIQCDEVGQGHPVDRRPGLWGVDEPEPTTLVTDLRGKG